MDQIISLWIDHCSPQLGTPVSVENVWLMSVALATVPNYAVVFFDYFGFSRMEYLYFKMPIVFITMALTARIITSFYILIGHSVAHRCNQYANVLLNNHQLLPNPSLSKLSRHYMSDREKLWGMCLSHICMYAGFFASDALGYGLLRLCGLSLNVSGYIFYTPDILFGAIPCAVFGFTMGRLIAYKLHLFGAQSLRQQEEFFFQAEDIVWSLNRSTVLTNNHLFLPPELLNTIFSYLTGEGETIDSRIINAIDAEHSCISEQIRKNRASNHHTRNNRFFSPQPAIDQPYEINEDIESGRSRQNLHYQ